MAHHKIGTEVVEEDIMTIERDVGRGLLPMTTEITDVVTNTWCARFLFPAWAGTAALDYEQDVQARR